MGGSLIWQAPENVERARAKPQRLKAALIIDRSWILRDLTARVKIRALPVRAERSNFPAACYGLTVLSHAGEAVNVKDSAYCLDMEQAAGYRASLEGQPGTAVPT
jgi:hypothetical protein